MILKIIYNLKNSRENTHANKINISLMLNQNDVFVDSL